MLMYGMNIPATDSLRHERVGLASNEDNSSTMVLKAYVETEETEELGANEPIEGLARPFPLMMNTTTPTVVESFIADASFEEFSDSFVEYVSLLYESKREGEWVDAVEEFDSGRLSDVETRLAESLLHYATQEVPLTLQRSVYREAYRLQDSDSEERILSNPLRDISGRDRYKFEYLPAMDEVDSWTLTMSEYEQETDSGETRIASSLWLRYTVNETDAERPIIAFQSEAAGYSAASPNVDYGEDMEDVADGVVSDILAGVDGNSALTPVDMDALEGTRTEQYLEAFVNES